MTRGKQKIEAQKRNAEKSQKAKGSQIEARAVALKISCPICKVRNPLFIYEYPDLDREFLLYCVILRFS